MESALLVSYTEKSVALLTELLSEASIGKVVALSSCGEARRLLVDREFDLVIINAPLRDESGETFARHIATTGMAQVILIVGTEHFDAVSAVCENDGVLVVAKPINKTVLWSALKLVRAAQSRLMRMQAENSKLKQKIEDIRIVDRAKCLLVFHRSFSETQAHRFIEKQAMDMRLSRRTIAEGIIQTYEE